MSRQTSASIPDGEQNDGDENNEGEQHEEQTQENKQQNDLSMRKSFWSKERVVKKNSVIPYYDLHLLKKTKK